VRKSWVFVRRSSFVVRRSSKTEKISIVAAIMISLSFGIITTNSEARTEGAVDPKVERAFLEGNYDKVLSDTTSRINARSNKSGELYYARGLANLKLNRFGVSRDDFNAILSKYPGTGRKFDAYMGIGDSYFLEGRFDDAVRSYEEMLVKFPGDANIPVVYYKIGCSYRKTGANSRADEYFEEAKRAAPLSFESRMMPTASYEQPVKTAPSGPSGHFTVQAGSFKNRENAEKFNRKLVSEGFESRIEPSSDGLYRIKVGNYNYRNEVESAASALKSRGYSTKICSGDAAQ
jgi:tetratricopeptide (TPR) repeat protein